MDTYVNVENNGFSMEEFEDIRLCLETLLSIRAGSQPLDRELGISLDNTGDAPAAVAQNKLAVEIVEKVEEYEPRVKVESVSFTGNVDGQLIPTVHISRAEDK